MAKDQQQVAGAVSQGANSNAGGTVARKKPVRKVYEHELTQAENFALQTVQRAASGLRTINDAIRSGKAINPEVVRLCHQLNQAIGDMLFTA